ncbi:hypothetical protein V6259_13065 [Marinomonas sp. TI.3.20]|uniref:hypothetical protein n=1 Tax=Marinomonas sp. TI.3.20 TaxID=3121296 RepID=UPI00311E4084
MSKTRKIPEKLVISNTQQILSNIDAIHSTSSFITTIAESESHAIETLRDLLNAAAIQAKQREEEEALAQKRAEEQKALDQQSIMEFMQRLPSFSHVSDSQALQIIKELQNPQEQKRTRKRPNTKKTTKMTQNPSETLTQNNDINTY